MPWSKPTYLYEPQIQHLGVSWVFSYTVCVGQAFPTEQWEMEEALTAGNQMLTAWKLPRLRSPVDPGNTRSVHYKATQSHYPPPPHTPRLHSPCLSSLLGKKRQPRLEMVGSSENMQPIWLLKEVTWLSIRPGRPGGLHLFIEPSDSWAWGSHLFTHVTKEKDTPFFALLLDIFHAGQS